MKLIRKRKYFFYYLGIGVPSASESVILYACISNSKSSISRSLIFKLNSTVLNRKWIFPGFSLIESGKFVESMKLNKKSQFN